MLVCFQRLCLAVLFSAVSIGCASKAFAGYPLAYVGYSEIRDVAMSPDGTSVATLKTQYYENIRSRRDWDDIEFTSTETGEAGYRHDLEDRLYYWISWPVNDVLLAQAMVYDIGRKSAKTQVQLLAINPVTGTERVLYSGDKGDYKKTRKVPRIMGISTENREIAIRIDTSGGRDLVVISIDTGARRVLARGSKKTLSWELGPDLTPFMRIDQGKRDDETQVYVLNEKGDWVLRQKFNSFENDFSPASYVSTEEEMLVVHRPSGAQTAALYRYDLGQNVYKDRLFDVPGHDITAVGRSKFGGELMYVGWFEDQLKKKWFDDDFEATAAKLDKALSPSDNWSIVETSEDNRRWLIFVSSPTRPGSYLFFDLDSKKARFIGDRRPELEPEHLKPIERVNYAAEDGTQLFGYFIQTQRGADAPLIVIPHGGPVARDYADFDGIAQYFAYKGYNIFQPQFRGGGELGLSFEESGFGEWGRAMQTDIEDGVTALVEQGLLSANSRRTIFGMSYGGYAALAAATLTPDNYACAISVNGVSDLPMMLASYDRTDPTENDVYNVWVKRIGDPQTDMDRILSVSPRQQMQNVHIPILLIHGTDDNIVDVEQSRAAYRTLSELQRPGMYHELEGAGHQIDDEDQRTEMLVMVDRFLSQCMPPW